MFEDGTLVREPRVSGEWVVVGQHGDQVWLEDATYDGRPGHYAYVEDLEEA